MASPILNVTELWIASTGEILDQSGTSQFHAQNNYANLILVNLEDGVGYDSTTLINFTPQTKSAYTSHWFYMSYQGLTEHEVNGEIRNFAQYAIRVPRVVLQNSNKNGFTVNDVVVKQTYGTNFIGQFATLAELNSEYPPTEELDDDNSIAYVIADADKGFYQVELDGTYGWTLMDNVALALESKQYNQFQIQVQAGSANPNDVVSVSAENVTVIMGILNNLQIDIDRIDANIDEIEYDAILLKNRVLTNEEDIDTLEGRATVNEEDIDLLEGRATNLETFQSTTIPATYETISNVDLVRDRVDDLETFKDVTVPATYETKTDATSKLALKVDKTTTIANVAIDNGITLDELKTAIGLATTSLSGLMSATDKGYLNELYALLDTDDVDVLVNTLGEILALFENYPEGTDIVTAFAGKVDKVLTAYDTLTGESVVGTEFVYVDAGGTAKKMTLAELFEASNSSAGAFVPNGVYEDLTSGYAIKSQSGIDIDEEFTEIDGRLDNIVDGTTVVEESYNSNTILTHDLTYVSDGDFKANLKTIDEDKIVFVKFPTTSSTSTLRVSLDNGVTYYNVVKNGKTMQAFIASGQLVRLEFDGTQFIGDVQGDVDIEATYGEPIESTYGEFAPLDGGVPLVTEIQGNLLDSEQLVTNGDFSDGTTGWTLAGSVLTNVSNNLIVTGDGNTKLPRTLNNDIFDLISKYYVVTNVRVTNAISNFIWIGSQLQEAIRQNTPTINQWYLLSNIFTPTTNDDLMISHDYLDSATANGKVMEVDYAYAFNISTLQSNKQYSPLYSTTFDLMSDAQIKAQMDAWVQDGTLPNEIQAVSNTSLQSVGKQLFDKSKYATDYAYKISVKPSTQYTWSVSALYKTYDKDMNEVSSGTNTTLTVASNVYHIAFSDIADKDTFMLVSGSVVGTYEPYKSSTQTFTHGPLYRLPNGVYDSIEYRNGKYYKVQRVKKYTLQVSDITATENVNGTQLAYTSTNFLEGLGGIYLKNQGNAFIGNKLRCDYSEIAVGYENQFYISSTYRLGFVNTLGTYANVEAAQTDLAGTDIYYQLATPIETEITDVDGLLLQDDVTTIYQLQDLATAYKVQFALNTEQTVKTLVERDRLQQGEIDSNEANIVTLTARKTTTNDIIIMSETAWSTYTQVTGEVYGVYNETTFVITWYYGQTE